MSCGREHLSEEAQYRLIFDSVSDGIVIHNPESSRIVEANLAAAEMFGYRREELIGKLPTDLVDAEPYNLPSQFPALAGAGPRYSGRIVAIRQDGTRFHVEARGAPFTLDGTLHVLTVLRDVSGQVEEERRLEEQVRERSREAEALLQANELLHRSLSLPEVLQTIADVAVDVLGLQFSSIMLRDSAEAPMMVRASRGFGRRKVRGAGSRIKEMPRQPAEAGELWVVEDTLGDPTVDQDLTAGYGMRAMVQVPMTIGGMAGVFIVGYDRPHRFGEHELRLYQSLARRAEVAIQNAALYERAQRAASLEERQRLARELHDSVSQALYGIALGARAARSLLDRDPSKVAEPLDYVLSLAEAGLAEMRALIFELRPESLETEGLKVALEKQAAAIRARYNVEVMTECAEELPLRLEQTETLYRVAQEAMHNVVKHAGAHSIQVAVERTNGVVELSIKDDGRGFATDGQFPGHLGLKSMRERAAASGGSLVIESAPGGGTTVQLRLPVGL